MTNSNRSTKNEGIQANNVKADVIAVGQNAHAEQHNYASGGQPDEKTLNELVSQLKQALASVAKERGDEVDAVHALTQDLIETGKSEKPNKKLLEIKGEGLKAAAKNLAEVAPTVVAIASQIVNAILVMHR
jgi:hypothetical protein